MLKDLKKVRELKDRARLFKDLKNSSRELKTEIYYEDLPARVLKLEIEYKGYRIYIYANNQK